MNKMIIVALLVSVSAPAFSKSCDLRHLPQEALNDGVSNQFGKSKFSVLSEKKTGSLIIFKVKVKESTVKMAVKRVNDKYKCINDKI